MAKTVKTTPTKTSTSKSKVVTKASPEEAIERICEAALEKLRVLGVNEQLQAEIAWCLGSYRNDKNPSGLYEMAGKALLILKEEKTKNAKAVPVKLIGDIEKAMKVSS